MSIGTSRDRSPVCNTIECRGAWIRTQIRSVAAVIILAGRVDDTNADLVIGHLCRFTALDTPLIVEIAGADIGDRAIADRVLSAFGAQCHIDHVEWALIADSHTDPGDLCTAEAPVLDANSIAEALQHFIRVNYARRNMPLPIPPSGRSDDRGYWRAG